MSSKSDLTTTFNDDVIDLTKMAPSCLGNYSLSSHLNFSNFNRFSLWFLGLDEAALDNIKKIQTTLSTLIQTLNDLKIESERRHTNSGALDATTRTQVLEKIDQVLIPLNSFISFIETERKFNAREFLLYPSIGFSLICIGAICMAIGLAVSGMPDTAGLILSIVGGSIGGIGTGCILQDRDLLSDHREGREVETKQQEFMNKAVPFRDQMLALKSTSNRAPGVELV